MPSVFLPLVVVMRLLTLLKLETEAVPVDPLLIPMAPLAPEVSLAEPVPFDL